MGKYYDITVIASTEGSPAGEQVLDMIAEQQRFQEGFAPGKSLVARF